MHGVVHSSSNLPKQVTPDGGPDGATVGDSVVERTLTSVLISDVTGRIVVSTLCDVALPVVTMTPSVVDSIGDVAYGSKVLAKSVDSSAVIVPYGSIVVPYGSRSESHHPPPYGLSVHAQPVVKLQSTSLKIDVQDPAMSHHPKPPPKSSSCTNHSQRPAVALQVSSVKNSQQSASAVSAVVPIASMVLLAVELGEGQS